MKRIGLCKAVARKREFAFAECRRNALGGLTVVGKLSNGRGPSDILATDARGRPTTYLSFMILKTTFSEPNRWFTAEELTKLLSAKYTHTERICRGLKLVDLLSENDSQPGEYRYNLNCKNVEMQTGFENFLVDVQLEALPIHIMLDYSPSFRSRTYL